MTDSPLGRAPLPAASFQWRHFRKSGRGPSIHMSQHQTLSGWGRWPRRSCKTVLLGASQSKLSAVASNGGMIARGLGRSYGDAAFNPALTMLSSDRERILDFDDQTGQLTAEAGLSLAEIVRIFVPRGWFPWVTPGTKFVTLAGMVASDVHGKNHHKYGSFGNCVSWFDIRCADGTTRRCSCTENVELFNATLGGCGLTGIILTVSFRLMAIPSAYVVQRTLPASNLGDALDIFEANLDATYSVAWIDCLAAGAARGRSLVFLGEHAVAADLAGPRACKPFYVLHRKTRRVPLDVPSWILNGHSTRMFNNIYFRSRAKRPDRKVIDYDSFFYPLDKVLGWNRLYGCRGFAQYQCALPLATSRNGLDEILEEVSMSGLGSFLAVLKRLGPGAPERPLSFPIKGYTLALDFPITGSSFALMARLDKILCRHGGRLYLAKDSRMSQATFEAGYSDGAATFRRDRTASGAADVFQSLLSKRLGL